MLHIRQLKSFSHRWCFDGTKASLPLDVMLAKTWLRCKVWLPIQPEASRQLTGRKVHRLTTIEVDSKVTPIFRAEKSQLLDFQSHHRSESSTQQPLTMSAKSGNWKWRKRPRTISWLITNASSVRCAYTATLIDAIQRKSCTVGSDGVDKEKNEKLQIASLSCADLRMKLWQRNVSS